MAWLKEFFKPWLKAGRTAHPGSLCLQLNNRSHLYLLLQPHLLLLSLHSPAIPPDKPGLQQCSYKLYNHVCSSTATTCPHQA
ncbi:hypothetical protein Pmani_022470 [Petrolisthes manimaculis]|uniref:Uncharacterized protein n=1 Tax=Petrolisthes manimaculis TaxID=1843537 RepID=A0AAE1PBN9_9EUCA|nr:hypothetical protein Pmani_022470 [Petrolisthes manimaculis]